MTIEFITVGHGRKSWIAELNAITYEEMRRSVHEHGAIANRSVDFVFDGKDRKGGKVIVGNSGRVVGSWRVLSGVARSEPVD